MACDILYFAPSGYQNVSGSLPRFFVHYGWSNSSRDTDPSAVSSFHVFHDCVCGVLCHWGFHVPNAYQNRLVDNWGKTGRFSSFRSVASQVISFEQHDGTSFLIPCGKHVGVTSLVFTLIPTPRLVLDLRQKWEIRFRRRRVVKWNLQLSFGGVLVALVGQSAEWAATARC